MSDNPNANRVYATLRLWGKALDPDRVTRLLHLTPSAYHRLGTPRGKKGIWPHAYWEIDSENQVVSTDLALHIEWLLNQIEPVQADFMALRATEIHADIFCFWESLTGHGGPVFSPLLLRRIAALNLTLGLDIYFAS